MSDSDVDCSEYRNMLYEVCIQERQNAPWRVIYTGPDLEYARAIENDMHDAHVKVRLDITNLRDRKAARK
jgi:hypothetical protein